ncbi:MAG: BrnT family toxin [Burkholderiales bacterium]
MNIDWDPNKAVVNFRKHEVSFAEAATVLTDDRALTREDPDSVSEQRFVSLGMSSTGALLVVVYTHREPNSYRIIAAWKASKPQRTQYEKNRR